MRFLLRLQDRLTQMCFCTAFRFFTDSPGRFFRGPETAFRNGSSQEIPTRHCGDDHHDEEEDELWSARIATPVGTLSDCVASEPSSLLQKKPRLSPGTGSTRPIRFLQSLARGVKDGNLGLGPLEPEVLQHFAH